MAIELQTTQQLVDRNIAVIESVLNQDIPATDQAFFRVLAVTLAMIETGMQKKLADDSKQNLAISATSGLADIGEDRGLVQEPAVAAVLTGTVPSDPAITIPATRSWISAFGIRYTMSASATEDGSGFITITVTADLEGVDGNLDIGAELKISSAVAGAGDTLTVTIIETIGAEEEDREVYRQEILQDQRAIKGGGNSADFRRWANVVAGVVQTYPYAGLPFGTAGPVIPPQRVVYVEVTTAIDPDGLAPQTILDDVEEAIINDPTTGQENQPLGINNSTLEVVSIRRTSIFTEVRGLDVPANQVAAIQAEIDSGLSSFLRAMLPFVQGLDFIGDKNDVVSDPILSRLVQDIVDTVGGSFNGLGFGLNPGAFFPSYTLGAGELAKNGGVVFVP